VLLPQNEALGKPRQTMRSKTHADRRDLSAHASMARAVQREERLPNVVNWKSNNNKSAFQYVLGERSVHRYRFDQAFRRYSFWVVHRGRKLRHRQGREEILDGLVDELEYWRRRMQRLTGITEQLKTRGCKVAL
jgi:hypothetical protein